MSTGRSMRPATVISVPGFTMSYLHHLFRAGEFLALRLASVHNLRFLARQMETMRAAIETGDFVAAKAAFDRRYRPVGFVSPAG